MFPWTEEISNQVIKPLWASDLLRYNSQAVVHYSLSSIIKDFCRLASTEIRKQIEMGCGLSSTMISRTYLPESRPCHVHEEQRPLLPCATELPMFISVASALLTNCLLVGASGRCFLKSSSLIIFYLVRRRTPASVEKAQICLNASHQHLLQLRRCQARYLHHREATHLEITIADTTPSSLPISSILHHSIRWNSTILQWNL